MPLRARKKKEKKKKKERKKKKKYETIAPIQTLYHEPGLPSISCIEQNSRMSCLRLESVATVDKKKTTIKTTKIIKKRY